MADITMQQQRFVRTEDQVAQEAVARNGGLIDPAPLVGCWINTNPSTTGIAKVVIEPDDGSLKLRAFGVHPMPQDWGEAKIDAIYASGAGAQDAMAFSASFDLGFMSAQLQANLSLGLLVIAAFNRFREASTCSNYFYREFFYREEFEGMTMQGGS